MARPEDTSANPVLREMDAQKFAAACSPERDDRQPRRLPLAGPAAAARAAHHRADRRRRTVAEIYTYLARRAACRSREDFYTQFEDLYVKLNGVNHLLLRFRT